MSSTNETTFRKTLARLSVTATTIDLLVSIFIVRMLSPIILPAHLVSEYGAILDLILLVPAVVLHLFVCELVFAGQSFGRFCAGLTITETNGSVLKFSTRIKRFWLKFFSLGLVAFNPNKLPFYNRSESILLSASLLGDPIESGVTTKHWRLTVISGQHKGSAEKLANVLKIGRETAWADLVLNKEQLVSSRHCIIERRGSGLVVSDVGTDGRGSKNGTTINGSMIPRGTWKSLGNRDVLGVANVKIRISS